MNSPVVLLAVADDQLPALAAERDAIETALRMLAAGGAITKETIGNPSADKVFAVMNAYRGRVAVFHYGGHANGTALRFVPEPGDTEIAEAGGLAGLFGGEAALQLVFLNGCATAGQVGGLLDAGVPAVIATAAPINDLNARHFAEQFYQALAAQATIRQAFERAKSWLKTTGAASEDRFRDMGYTGPASLGDPAALWALYTRPDKPGAADWSLPTQSKVDVILRGWTPPGTTPPPNDQLIMSLFNAIAPSVPLDPNDPDSAAFNVYLQMIKAGGKVDTRQLRGHVINRVPAPIGEQIIELVKPASDPADRPAHLLRVWRVTAQLFAYAALAQLWDVTATRGPLHHSESAAAVIKRFCSLDAASEVLFDHAELLLAVLESFEANGVVPFMAECSRLPAALATPDAITARQFMAQLAAELAAGPIPPTEVTSYAVQAERHLVVLMQTLSFIAGYNLATIKSVAVRARRHQEPIFMHRRFLLDMALLPPSSDDYWEAPRYTDDRAVVLMKGKDDPSHFLNLSPLVLDENALNGNDLSKLFLFCCHDETTNRSLLRLSADVDTVLTVSDELYPEVRDAVRDLRAALLAEPTPVQQAA
jgi:hypothetical protein